jgi:hypothetical protein
MPCGICRQAGHNRSTCPQRNITGIPLQRVTPTPPVMAPVPRISSQTPLQIRTRWKKAIKSVLYFRRYAKIVSRWSHLGYDDPRIYYPSWMKVKDLKGHMSDEITNHWKYRIYHCMDDMIAVRLPAINVFQCIRNACLLLHLERRPAVPTLPDDNKHICLNNLREENYLVYWVVGNYMVEEMDGRENKINYMGLLLKGGSFKVKTLIGHRFYLVPHRLNTNPPYHPQTDKQFFIEPYCQINIHEGTERKIYIDDKDSLSEMNKWKFNALKLDYLIKEVIKLGGKNNDVLESILDLHEDVKLGSVSEMEKDMAGIPSLMTNIT